MRNAERAVAGVFAHPSLPNRHPPLILVSHFPSEGIFATDAPGQRVWNTVQRAHAPTTTGYATGNRYNCCCCCCCTGSVHVQNYLKTTHIHTQSPVVFFIYFCIHIILYYMRPHIIEYIFSRFHSHTHTPTRPHPFAVTELFV